MSKLKISILLDRFAICQYSASDSIDERLIEERLKKASFYSITFTPEEKSIIIPEQFLITGGKVETGWKALKLHGPLYFSMIGTLASIATPLAKANISILTLSTYFTDYIFIKEKDLPRAIDTLKKDGFVFD